MKIAHFHDVIQTTNDKGPNLTEKAQYVDTIVYILGKICERSHHRPY